MYNSLPSEEDITRVYVLRPAGTIAPLRGFLLLVVKDKKVGVKNVTFGLLLNQKAWDYMHFPSIGSGVERRWEQDEMRGRLRTHGKC